jgi:hypothetical protein
MKKINVNYIKILYQLCKEYKIRRNRIEKIIKFVMISIPLTIWAWDFRTG